MYRRTGFCLVMFAALTACYGDARPSSDTARAIANTGSASDTTTAAPELAGTSWRLVRIQSMADSTFTPTDPSHYTITFGADGKASMRVDCNRGSATWSSLAQGQLTFGPAAMTRAACAPGSLFDRVVRDLPYFRTYVLRNGRLHLATMADGAIYEFEPLAR